MPRRGCREQMSARIERGLTRSASWRLKSFRSALICATAAAAAEGPCAISAKETFLSSPESFSWILRSLALFLFPLFRPLFFSPRLLVVILRLSYFPGCLFDTTLLPPRSVCGFAMPRLPLCPSHPKVHLPFPALCKCARFPPFTVFLRSCNVPPPRFFPFFPSLSRPDLSSSSSSSSSSARARLAPLACVPRSFCYSRPHAGQPGQSGQRHGSRTCSSSRERRNHFPHGIVRSACHWSVRFLENPRLHSQLVLPHETSTLPTSLSSEARLASPKRAPPSLGGACSS